MHRQLRRQPGRGPPQREPVIHRPRRHPVPPLGHQQRRLPVRPVPGPDLAHVLLEGLRGPRQHRGHRPPPRRAAPHRLAEPNLTDPEAAQLRCPRIDREVPDVEHHRLPPAQPPAVDHLEQRGVPKRRQPPLSPRPAGLLHPVVGGVEERLQLRAGQRPARRAALRGHVHRGVALVADLHRTGPHPLLALGHPPVARIGHETQEAGQRPLVGTHRRMRPAAPGDERLDLLGRPGPRPPAGERLEPAHHPLPTPDQRLAQPPAQLLPPPSGQHRLEQRGFRPQRPRAVHQHQRRRPRHPSGHDTPVPRHQTPQCAI